MLMMLECFIENLQWLITSSYSWPLYLHFVRLKQSLVMFGIKIFLNFSEKEEIHVRSNLIGQKRGLIFTYHGWWSRDHFNNGNINWYCVSTSFIQTGSIPYDFRKSLSIFFSVLFNVLFIFILPKGGCSFPFYPWSPNALGRASDVSRNRGAAKFR